MTDVSTLPGGGIVLFPANGIYKVEDLALKSNVTLYVEAGAQIKGTGRFTYQSLRNTKIRGHGCIDMPRGHQLTQCREVSLEDVFIRTSTGWTIHARNSDSLTLRNIKILNHSLATDPNGYTDDAMDFNNSSNILVDDVFGFEIDDFVGITGWNTTPTDMTNITIRNCVACNDFRFLLIKGAGEGFYNSVKNLTIENCQLSHFVSKSDSKPPMYPGIGIHAFPSAHYGRSMPSSPSGHYGMQASGNENASLAGHGGHKYIGTKEAPSQLLPSLDAVSPEVFPENQPAGPRIGTGGDDRRSGRACPRCPA